MITISHVLIHLRDDYTCQLCNEEFSPLNSNLEVDHIFPKSYARFSHPYNLQALCKNCNYEKFNFLEEVQPVMILNAYEKSNKYWNDDEIDEIWDQLSLYYGDSQSEIKVFGRTLKESQEDNHVKRIIKFVKTNNSKYLMPIFDICMMIKKDKEDQPSFYKKIPEFNRRRKKIQISLAIWQDLTIDGISLLENTYIRKAEEFDDPIIQNQWINEYKRVKSLLQGKRMR